MEPAPGLNPSWQAGPALARIHDVAWGPDLVFTFGPLAFLQHTPYYSFDQSLLATIYQPIVIIALFLGVAAALRQRQTPPTAVIGSFVTTGVLAVLHTGHGLAVPGLEYPELAVLAALAWAAVPLLQEHPNRGTVYLTCMMLGVAGGLQLLIKINAGMSIAIIALAVSLLVKPGALVRHGVTLAAFIASTVLCWVIAGQHLRNLPVWLKHGAAIVSGYSDGEGLPLSAFAVMAGPAGVIVLALLAILFTVFLRSKQDNLRKLAVLIALVVAFSAKKFFVRLDITSFYALLGLTVVATVITPLASVPRIPRRVFVGSLVVVIGVGLVSEIAVLGRIKDPTGSPIIAAVRAPGQAIDRIVSLAVPGRLQRRIDEAKARQRSLYDIPDHFIATIGSAPVHVDPNETSAVWAYGLSWHPAPVFQTYVAFSPALDQLNSHSLAAGPQFVLSRRSPNAPATGIDGRLGVQESPLYSRTLLCDFTLSGVQNRWALFTLGASHCGPLKIISEATARREQQVSVPTPSRPDTAILVGIDVHPGIADRLMQGMVLPLTIPTVAIDGINYRLVAANAAEPFLLNSPVSVDDTNLQIHAHTISIGRVPGLDRNDTTVRFRFYEMTVA